MSHSRKKMNLEKKRSKRRIYRKLKKTKKRGGYAEGYVPPYEQKHKTRQNRGRTVRAPTPNERRVQQNTGPIIINKADGTTFYSGKLRDIGRYNGDVIHKDNQYLPHGQGTMEYNIGDKYRGQWNEGNRHGIGSYTIPNQNKTFEGNWENDAFKPGPL